ncbi:MAG: hypothetical protein GXY46_02110 [Actinobacteria bacterium]|nr:hypothetical protein [Actinomycetota bacterium]
MRIEENGPETCKVARSGGFVLVRVPVRVLDDIDYSPLTFRYTIGGFVGRESKWPSSGKNEIALHFRIPLELFRDRERFTVEVLRPEEQSRPQVLWSARREVRWQSGTPGLEPLEEPAPTF